MWSLQFLQRTDVAKESACLWETFYKRWYCTYQEFFIYARKSKAKSLKYFSKGILLSVKLQNKHLLLLGNYLKYFAENFCISYYTFNSNIHKLGSQDPKQYIFGDQFYSKNARKFRFHVLLHFHARKHIIILSEVDQFLKKLWISFQLSSEPWGSITGTKLTISSQVCSL